MAKTLYNFGCRVSAWGADLAGHPFSILTVAVVCAAWFIIGGTSAENTLTLALSVLAITLTQMVLNQQRLSERALHMKIDELVFAMNGARDEIAGIERKTEEELEALRRTGDIAEDVLQSRHTA
ncbi:low affinity iron permease family protein [Sphingomonas nostoxanthinifaciens]|uniref:low affinity iron permease family protein n=1 Tax=Sphingomonas nostoxanthinifaciens TaxID=2872652 RepID=UPI001CC1FF0E|nr:low affinity iron permease family protein [Sphingomonas nostoxanthinifaciens]UAK25686.1 low affinity iron permease family protein [Sphingomonas nostoxanthinifaciens]